MSNKNDFSDLIEFFTGIAAVVFVIIALFFFGFSRLDKKYINLLNAKITSYQKYIDRQWNIGVPKSPAPKLFESDFLPW